MLDDGPPVRFRLFVDSLFLRRFETYSCDRASLVPLDFVRIVRTQFKYLRGEIYRASTA